MRCRVKIENRIPDKKTTIASKDQTYLSPDAYLEGEKSSPIKHEYIQGEVCAMAGACDAHVTIAGNLFALLRSHVRGSGCRVYMSDMKARIETMDIFYYPDVMVTCDESDRQFDYFKRYPCLIVEVLSDSTESRDRGDKFADYRELSSLQEYVLISQS
ncbi:MAG: Uma2 family endonuclease, partial [Cyanobacteriota bacterium]|nr:Uma2 family endonuclease [Cyanobacteriota bacterium]